MMGVSESRDLEKLRLANGGFWLSGLVASIIDLGILEECETSATAAELSRRLESRHGRPLRPEFLDCALAWLERLGAIYFDDGRLTATEVAAVSKPWLQPTAELWQAFGQLSDRAFEDVVPRYYESLSASEELGFAATMEAQLLEVVDELAGKIPSNARTLVDVGGGTGLLAQRFSASKQGRSATVVDQSSSARVSGSAPANEAIRFIDADLRTGLKDLRPADCVALVRVLHDWPEKEAARILASSRSALAAGGTLLVAEEMYSGNSCSDVWPALLDIFLRCYMGEGRMRRVVDVESLLAQAGFVAISRPERVGWATVLLATTVSPA